MKYYLDIKECTGMRSIFYGEILEILEFIKLHQKLSAESCTYKIGRAGR